MSSFPPLLCPSLLPWISLLLHPAAVAATIITVVMLAVASRSPLLAISISTRGVLFAVRKLLLPHPDNAASSSSTCGLLGFR